MQINYDSPRDLADFLKSRNIWLKKRFGQNFLVNPGTRKKLLDLLELSGEEYAWEIGPGLGCLTGHILEATKKLIVFEIDRGLVRILRELYPELDVREGDAVDTWPGVWNSEGTPERLFGNLPYSCGAAIIGSFIEEGLSPPRMVFMVQKEQALRMTAKPGGPSYSAFSALCASAYRIEQAGDVKPGSFFPSPAVMSTIVVMTPNTAFNLRRKDLFLSLTKDLFAKKRKTIRNNLATGRLAAEAGSEILFSVFRDLNVSLSLRAEELPAETIAACSDNLGDILDMNNRKDHK